MEIQLPLQSKVHPGKELTSMRLSDLGIVIKPAEAYRQQWILSDVQVHTSPALRQNGTVVFIAHNKMGTIVKDVEFIVGWQDGITYPIADYKGRFRLRLDRVYDPTFGSGPYWAGFSEEGIGPEIHGFGIPIGHSCEIKIVFAQV